MNEEKVLNVINNIETFSEEELRKLFRYLNNRNFHNLTIYDNPISTNKDASDLQEILVQTIINFINDRKLNDIEEVSFKADSLNESAKYGKWTPATDSYISLIGYQYDEDIKLPVRKLITESF